ncbi:hypothetical protein OIU74_024309 [Salix koriyanagi]|uniref:Uncharacterized protein n=1 Tax=Salix koriyanagi TaxID=2511006 RepID=A0A9Q0W9R0_9ROSI|nr:hypothetical protein OIU74_024309 [Salix koriyanagi]
MKRRGSCAFNVNYLTCTNELCIFSSFKTPFLNSEIASFASSSSAHSSANSNLKSHNINNKPNQTVEK